MASPLDSMSLEQLQALRAQTVSHMAINQNESSGAPDSAAGIVNPASGARGNMQVMPATAGDPGFGVKPSNGTPQDDARMGRDYMDALTQKYGDPETAAIAYNMGPGKADNWIANGRNLNKLPLETLQYLRNYKTYSAAHALPDQPATPVAPAATALAPQATTAPAPPQGSITDQVLRQIGLTARAAGHGVADAAGAATQGFTRLMGVPDVRDVINNTVNKYTPQPQGAIENAVQGVGSQVANPVNYMIPGGGLARGAIGGAALAGMQPTAPGATPGQVAQNMAIGGATGGALGGLGRVIGGGNITPAAQSLMDQKVNLTPGQALGGLANSIEQKATSIPVVGDMIKGARGAAVQDFNKAIGNQVLAPIGQKAPDSTGRQFIDDIGSRISDQYNQILPRLTFKVDPQMAQDMAPILKQVQALPPDTQNAFNNIWQRNFGSQLSPNGTMPGTVFKQADSVLGGEAANFRGSTDAFQRQLGGLLTDTQAVMRNSLQRTNPNEPALGPVNQAWRNYTVLRNAGARVNNPEAPIQPGQFQSAVKAGDQSLQKGRFATGQANMQPLSDAGMSVLGSTVPDSGTAGRGALIGLPAAVAGLSSAAMNGHPMPAILSGAGYGLGAAAYGTNAGRQAMLAALAKRPDLVRAFGGKLGLLAPRAGAVAAGAASASPTDLDNRTADQQ